MAEATTELHFGARGMTCTNSARVERALRWTEGVVEASLNLATGWALRPQDRTRRGHRGH